MRSKADLAHLSFQSSHLQGKARPAEELAVSGAVHATKEISKWRFSGNDRG
jgi:hypothetical protein